ncbi:MAG: tRNA (adenosine(37)-N6)-dimethylallyltransferase MiaA, partial [Oscillospiraceae bacterium]
TGLYIDSVVNNISYCEEKKVGAVREKLLKQADLMGMQYMHDMLYLCDEETAKRLHVNDKKRILRALEIFELHGKSMSEMMVLSRQNPSPYKAVLIGIAFRDRQKLYDRIDRRVDNMLENGLLEEARQAYESKNRATSAQAIGHKELFKYFEGNATLEAAAEHLKMQTRRYAKRQMTWFKKNDNIKWIYADEQDVISEALKLSEEVFG